MRRALAEGSSSAMARVASSRANSCDFVEAEQRRIGRLLLRLIFSRGFAQRRGRFLDVQNVVGHLEGPANLFAESAQPRQIVWPPRRPQSRPDTTDARISAAVFER